MAILHLESDTICSESSTGHRTSAWGSCVAAFLLVYVISYMDRQILSIVVGPVKASLGLSDVEIGLVQGVGFSLVLALAAVLMSPLVDRGNRVRVLSVCIVIWCSMTILCGFATNLMTLLVARAGLALAEGIVPVAVLSIIFDLAPPGSVARASALFMTAPFIGSGLALLLGGPSLALLEEYKGAVLPWGGVFEPWRGLFWGLGALGLVLGIILPRLVREPPRRVANDGSVTSVLPFLRTNLTFFSVLCASISMYLVAAYSIYAWIPAYMIRVHGLSPATAGLTIGAIIVVSGISGCLFSAWVMGRGTEHYAMSHVVRTLFRLQWFLWPPLILMAFVPSTTIALILLSLSFFLLTSGLSSALTPFAMFAPAGQRGQLLAVAGLIESVTGGLGPVAVGAINDFVLRTPDRIGLSLAMVFTLSGGVGVLTGRISVRHAVAMDDRILKERKSR